MLQNTNASKRMSFSTLLFKIIQNNDDNDRLNHHQYYGLCYVLINNLMRHSWTGFINHQTAVWMPLTKAVVRIYQYREVVLLTAVWKLATSFPRVLNFMPIRLLKVSWYQCKSTETGLDTHHKYQ